MRTNPSQASEAIMEAAEVTNASNLSDVSTGHHQDPRFDVSRMDPDSVRLRWKDFPDRCLVTQSDTSKGDYVWSVSKCQTVEMAWFRQRYLLPMPGESGQIKSQIGKVVPGNKEYCLTVPYCFVGTPVRFSPCGAPDIHNTFKIQEYKDGTVRIRSECPADTCIDLPDTNTSTGNAAQIWPCHSADNATKNALLAKDEVLSVGISENSEKAYYDNWELLSYGGAVCESCTAKPISKAMGGGLKTWEVHCPVSDSGSKLHLSFEPYQGKDEKLGSYATIWTLYCAGAQCICKAHESGIFATLPRLDESLTCGVLMLSTHPVNGECPKDLENLHAAFTESGEVDCAAGKEAVRELQKQPHSFHRLALQFVQAQVHQRSPHLGQDPSCNASNMDPNSVMLRWKKSSDQCLVPTGNVSEEEFLWAYRKCLPTEEAWFQQGYLLPKLGESGQIKSEIGKVSPGRKEYCLTVPYCVMGTPVKFTPCTSQNAHNTFSIHEDSDGTMQIRTQCPLGACIDLPQTNSKTAKAQIWSCQSVDNTTQEALLRKDETFIVGLSESSVKAFNVWELLLLPDSGDRWDSCAPYNTSKLEAYNTAKLEADSLQGWEVGCQTLDHGNELRLLFGPSEGREGELGSFDTIWSLYCSGTQCACKAHEPGVVANVSREHPLVACGALMLSTHPIDGECPPDLRTLETKVTQSGKVDCDAARDAARDLHNHPLTRHRLELRYFQVELHQRIHPHVSVRNMDPGTVRLRWKSFKDQCLVTHGNTIDAEEFVLTAEQCRPMEEAWFRQRYTVPPLGESGQIKSQIGKVASGNKEYCLTVPHCQTGTPLKFRPCETENIHNTFTMEKYKDGTVRLRSEKCPEDQCVDLPVTNSTKLEDRIAQILPCPFYDKHADMLLSRDLFFSVGISNNTMNAFDSMELRSVDGPSYDDCAPVRVSKAKGEGLQSFEVSCPISLVLGKQLHMNFSKSESQEDLGPYASIWSLYCIGKECVCKAHKQGNDSLTAIPRLRRSVSCGVLVLSTQPEEGECPGELQALEANLTQHGEVDCMMGRQAVRDLENDKDTSHRLELRFIQVGIVGLNPEDFRSFIPITVSRLPDSKCNITNTTSNKTVDNTLEFIEIGCPFKDGRDLKIEAAKNASVVEARRISAPGVNHTLSNGAAYWSLWCIEDVCVCKPLIMDDDRLKELWSTSINHGQKGCGVIMLSPGSFLGSCPKGLTHLQNIIENDPEVDCPAGRAEAERMARAVENRVFMSIKWVDIKRNLPLLTKTVKKGLDIFSVLGAIMVVGTVPAWPAVAKFSQFLVMMASNHAELALPSDFSHFAHKFTQTERVTEPFRKITIPGVKELGGSLVYLSSSEWFVMKDRFINKTMQMVLRVYRDSGLISPGLNCYLSHYYDPVRGDLRDVSEVLQPFGGVDPCGGYAASDDAVEGRLLVADAPEAVADVAAGIRKQWVSIQVSFGKQIEFLKKSLHYSRKEFSVYKNLLFALMVLPILILVYSIVYFVLWMTKSKYTYIPTVHPLFLLLFIADLVLLNVLMAWGNVTWRRRLLTVENPFIMLDDALIDFGGFSFSQPITSAILSMVSLFRPIISMVALIPPLHANLFQSIHIASLIFILGPCAVFLAWFLSFWFGKISRHPDTNHFMDEDCSYVKGTLPVMGFFQRQLFYEQPEVLEVEKIIAHEADSQALYKDGKVQAKMEVHDRFGLLFGELKALWSCCCCSKKEKKINEGIQLPLEHDDELAKTMANGDLDFSWAFRIKGLDVNYRGLPKSAKLAFETTQEINIKRAIRPHIRLRISRGNQLISVAFQARSQEEAYPFPHVRELEPEAKPEEVQDAANMTLAKELLQSTWKRLLLKEFEGILASKGVQAGSLRWTMWDDQEGWTAAAFNLELIRPLEITDDDFVKLSSEVKDMVLDGFLSWGTKVLQEGWREARILVEPRRRNVESTHRPVQEAKIWCKLAEATVKKSLKSKETDNAFVEVDHGNSRVFGVGGHGGGHESDEGQSEAHDEGHDEGQQDEDGQREGPGVAGMMSFQRSSLNSLPSSAALGDPKGLNVEIEEEAQGFLTNVAAATSFIDEHLEHVEEVTAEMYDMGDREIPALTLTSDFLRQAKRGDLVEIWIAGNDASEDQSGQASDPMIGEKSWKNLLESASCARFIAPPIVAWEDPRNPFEEVTVIRKKQEVNHRWMEAISRFPMAYVGKVEAPIKLHGGFSLDMDIRVRSRDLLHLDHQVPMKVPFSHLQLAERDRWRVFFLNDHQHDKSENPQLLKMIHGLNLFFMIISVIYIPRLIKAKTAEGAEDAGAELGSVAQCKAGAEGCNIDNPELKEMTDQMHRQTAVMVGISTAMLAIAVVVLVKVLINTLVDGDVRPSKNVLGKLKDTIKSEWAHLKRIFNREACERVTLQELNYSKLVGDITLEEAFSRAMKKCVQGAQAEEVHLELEPGSEDAIVYAEVPADFPTDKMPSVKLSSSSSSSVTIQLNVMDQGADKSKSLGCKPSSMTDSVSRLLAKHGGSTSAGWFNSLKAAAEHAMEKASGNATQDPGRSVVYAYRVTGATFSELRSQGGHEDALKQALADAAEVDVKEVKAVELTCNSIQVIISYPQKYHFDIDHVSDNFKAEKELEKAMTGKTVSPPPRKDKAAGRCPGWLGLGFVVGVVKFLIILLLGVMTLVNHGTILQAVCAVIFGLLLWMLSRTLFSHMVEGAVFRSSTMEIGQVSLLVIPVILQLELLEPITCSVMMIVGVLWAIVTLCWKYVRDKTKKHQKKISKIVKFLTQSLKDTTTVYANIRDGIFWAEFKEFLGEFKICYGKALSVWWHGVSASTRNPVWVSGMAFAILFFLGIMVIRVLQDVLLQAVGANQHGSRPYTQIPGLLAISVLSVALLGFFYMVFMAWLPAFICEFLAKEQLDEHQELAMESSKAVWVDRDTAEKDVGLQKEILNELIERSRAFPQNDEPVVEGADYQAVTVESDRKQSILFEPLNAAVPLYDVAVFADDGATQLDGSLRLQSGALPVKRLLCTDWAWNSPRWLVERTPLQVRVDFLTKTGEGSVRPDLKEEPVPDVGLSGQTKTYPTLEVLVCTLQVINFVGLTLGKTDKHDGVLCLWRSPELSHADQLVKWFEEVRCFFADYGASFERGSRVYPLLENLFLGVKEGSGEGYSPGDTVQDHKRGHMIANGGKPYRAWLDRCMLNMVELLGQNRPKNGVQENEEVSDDEQHLLEKEKHLANDPQPSVASDAGLAMPAKGPLVLDIVGASGLPVGQGTTDCRCVVSTREEQITQTSAAATSEPKWNHQQLFSDFQPGMTKLDLTVNRNGSQLATATLLLRPEELSGSDWVQKALDLDILDEAGNTSCGCTGKPMSKPKLLIRASWSCEEASDPGPEWNTRPKAADGFCGGPLAWTLLHPAAVPELMHVAVTVEDLHVCLQRPRPKPFMRPPVLGRRGAEPPIRGTRALGREPGREEESEEPFQPSCDDQRLLQGCEVDSSPVDMQEATSRLDDTQKQELKKILGRGNVALDMKLGTLNFKKRIVAVNRASDAAVIDAAAVLQVYNTLKVKVEGQTGRTEADKDQALSLAQERAEKVMDGLALQLVDRSRLSTVAKRGRSFKPIVMLRFVK